MNTENRQYRLSDGRWLGYAEFGDLSGAPEFYFPGFPGSSIEGKIMESVARSLSVRIIAVERPGFGLSTIKPGRRLIDWPDDLVELADYLGLKRFSVMGHSGGGPYAAACAARIPHRLTAVGMVNSVGPADAPQAACGLLRLSRLAYQVSQWSPRLLPYGLTARCISRNAEKVVPLLDRFASEPDKRLLVDPQLRSLLIASHRGSARFGHAGIEQELRIFTDRWGFRLEDITMPVHVWHGEQDTVIPAAVGRYIADALPQCRARFYDDEGHVSVPINRMEDILGSMAIA